MRVTCNWKNQDWSLYLLFRKGNVTNIQRRRNNQQFSFIRKEYQSLVIYLLEKTLKHPFAAYVSYLHNTLHMMLLFCKLCGDRFLIYFNSPKLIHRRFCSYPRTIKKTCLYLFHSCIHFRSVIFQDRFL